MAFTNINDPAGVKSLLEQLRTSQAWQDTVETDHAKASATNPTHTANEPGPSTSLPSTDGEGTSTGSSVASLLSQLQSSPTWSTAQPVPSPPTRSPPVYAPTTLAYTPGANALASTTPFRLSPSRGASSAARQDVRSYTFQQALPHLAQLSDDPNFVASLSTMKQQQAQLEQRLFQERCAIRTKHEEKVKVAQSKAKIFGAGLSKHEADMMSDAYRKELNKFDTERVLVAWDSLVAKQQAALENMAVPAMFVTSSKADRERQQKVVQVLEGITGSEDT